MALFGMSRRKIFETGGFILAGSAVLAGAEGASAQASDPPANAAVVRKWYKSWETKDWDVTGTFLTDDFTFTSPTPDDHISKVAFKKNCWETQIDFIKSFDMELLMAQGDDVLVKYLCHIKGGKSFRNVEYHRLRNQRIASIECYFGGQMTYPSSVASQKT
jgi:ketosteroid isomerase-like protein